MPYDYNDMNAPGTGYTGYEMGYAPGQSPEALAAAAAQKAYTDKNFMAREDFLKKYGETFVANDKGGNAASEVAGRNVGEYYDQFLDPNRKAVEAKPSGGDEFNFDPSAAGATPGWGNGFRFRDQNPNFDAWDNVKPHPESQDLGGLGETWRTLGRPAATAAAMYFGVNALGAMAGTAAAPATGGLSTAGGGSLGAAADFGAGTYAAGAGDAAATVAAAGGPGSATWGMDLGMNAVGAGDAAAAVGGPGSAGWGMDLGTADAASAIGGNADKAALYSNAGYGEGMKPGLWDQAKALVKDIPMKKALGALQMLGGASGGQSQQSQQSQGGPLSTYVANGGVQPYDWQKIQNAANRAGMSMSEYVAQNQKYLNAGLYPG